MSAGLLNNLLLDFVLLLANGLLYYYIRRKFVYLVSSMLIGLATFALVFVLSKNDFGVATGIGLFAIFGIIRYRTEQVPIIEMTHLFISITISVVIAIADNLTMTTESAVVLSVILIIITFLLFFLNSKNEITEMSMVIDNLDWMKKNNDEKTSYLSDKCGSNVVTFKIESIDHLRETCKVIVFCK